MTVDNTRQLATNPDLQPLWRAIHQRMCTGVEPAAIVTVTADLGPAAIASLRSWIDRTHRRRNIRSAITATPGGHTVPVRELLDVLGLTHTDLIALVETATGAPVVNQADRRRTTAAQRHDLAAFIAEMLPRTPVLADRLRAAGLAAEEQTRQFVRAVAAALQRIPADPPISLPKLAHDCTGDPHYFDLNILAGSRLVAAIAEHRGEPEPTRPDHIRALLARAGIIADRLSATVLLYRVPTIGDGPIDRRLHEAPHPVALTLLDLTATPPTFGPHTLTVVENPSVLEAAMLLPHPPPLACTSGQLRGVDHPLLQLAYDQQVRLRYAGDLDAPGMRIAGAVASLYGADIIAMDGAHGRADQHSDVDIAGSGGGRLIVYQEDDAMLRWLFESADHNR